VAYNPFAASRAPNLGAITEHIEICILNLIHLDFVVKGKTQKIAFFSGVPIEKLWASSEMSAHPPRLPETQRTPRPFGINPFRSGLKV
jgi:hypothetical protein